MAGCSQAELPRGRQCPSPPHSTLCQSPAARYPRSPGCPTRTATLSAAAAPVGLRAEMGAQGSAQVAHAHPAGCARGGGFRPRAGMPMQGEEALRLPRTQLQPNQRWMRNAAMWEETIPPAVATAATNSCRSFLAAAGRGIGRGSSMPPSPTLLLVLKVFNSLPRRPKLGRRGLQRQPVLRHGLHLLFQALPQLHQLLRRERRDGHLLRSHPAATVACRLMPWCCSALLKFQWWTSSRSFLLACKCTAGRAGSGGSDDGAAAAGVATGGRRPLQRFTAGRYKQ